MTTPIGWERVPAGRVRGGCGRSHGPGSKRWPAFLIILALTCALEAEPANPPAGLLVKWKDGPTSASAAEANARIGATVKRNFNAVGWQLVEPPARLSQADGLKAYQAFDSVAAVEADRKVPWAPPPSPETAEPPADAPVPNPVVALSGPTPASVTPNDPKFSQQSSGISRRSVPPKRGRRRPATALWWWRSLTPA